MFSKFDSSKYASVAVIDYTQLNSFFCRTEEEIALEEEQKRKLLENQVEISFVIDQKRISEIAMCINTIKMSPDEIVEALINVDEWCFDEDTI